MNSLWTAQAAVFRNTIDNYVFLTARGDSLVGGVTLPSSRTTRRPRRCRASNLRGVGRRAGTLVVGFMADLLHAEQAEGTPLSFMPPARLGGSLQWDNGAFSAGGDLHHEFAQRRIGAADELPTDAHSVVRLQHWGPHPARWAVCTR